MLVSILIFVEHALLAHAVCIQSECNEKLSSSFVHCTQNGGGARRQTITCSFVFVDFVFVETEELVGRVCSVDTASQMRKGKVVSKLFVREKKNNINIQTFSSIISPPVERINFGKFWRENFSFLYTLSFLVQYSSIGLLFDFASERLSFFGAERCSLISYAL